MHVAVHFLLRDIAILRESRGGYGTKFLTMGWDETKHCNSGMGWDGPWDMYMGQFFWPTHGFDS